jgi:hypothetical protein
MSTLPELQAAFRRAMLEDDDAVAVAVAGDGLEPAARLRIYRHHVLTTLTAVLEGAFPVVRRLVGEGFFAYAADRHIRRHPPAGPCLDEYGATFPDFLAGFPPCQPLGYLPDVARLEWAIQAALHAPDLPALDPAALAGVPPAAVPRLVFRLDPSLALLASPWPIDRIWRANQPEADPDATVELGPDEARLEVRRVGDDVGVRRLAAPAFAFRQALGAGRPLGDAAEAALALDAEFDLTAALQALFQERLLTGSVLGSATEETP